MELLLADGGGMRINSVTLKGMLMRLTPSFVEEPLPPKPSPLEPRRGVFHSPFSYFCRQTHIVVIVANPLQPKMGWDCIFRKETRQNDNISSRPRRRM